MEGIIKVNGCRIKCMEKDFLNGKTEGHMKETMSMIKKKGGEFLNGLIRKGMKDFG